MAMIWAERALLSNGWASNVAITIAGGRITGIETGAAPVGHRTDILLTAPANLHSHAFQRAMAGLTEARGPDPRDTFWTWRQLMYRFLDRLTPDHVRAIAAFVQMEMLEAGYACNVEFHYLHHAQGGQAYDNLAQMAASIAEATSQTGIGLTLLPVHYQFGGCDGRPLSRGQDRFHTNPDSFLALHEASAQMLRNLPADTVLGAAPHSLRAVSVEGLRVSSSLSGPVHMHLAEQRAEVDEVLAHHGARPVEWLLENAPVDPRWCLIHCTQMQPHETTGLAQSGAVAGLCPITEANLGDGIFDGLRYMDAGGRIGMGSDSNIRISLSEELRQLDHSQRLRDHSRAALATEKHSTGRRLLDEVAAGGAQAAGRGNGTIAVGQWADLLSLDAGHVDLEGRMGDKLLDSFVFAGGREMIKDVWSAGRHQVRNGRHIAREAIIAAYRQAQRDLRDTI